MSRTIIGFSGLLLAACLGCYFMMIYVLQNNPGAIPGLFVAGFLGIISAILLMPKADKN